MMERSFNTEPFLVLIDENGNEIDYMTKYETHKNEKLHRAFSIYLYDNESEKLLLQKRAKGKYHSGGLWSNSCCSHPYKNESLKNALVRCIENELSLSPHLTPAFGDDILSLRISEDNAEDVNVFFAGKFIYYQKYSELAEYEMDHVFIFIPTKEEIMAIKANPNEIENTSWLTFSEIDKKLQDTPDDFTAWFKESYNLIKTYIQLK